MLTKLNNLIAQLLLETEYRFLRHLLIFLMVTLITINILWDEPTAILTDRYGAWTVYLPLFLVVIYANMYGLVPKLLLQGKTKKYVFTATALMVFFPRPPNRAVGFFRPAGDCRRMGLRPRIAQPFLTIPNPILTNTRL